MKQVGQTNLSLTNAGKISPYIIPSNDGSAPSRFSGTLKHKAVDIPSLDMNTKLSVNPRSEVDGWKSGRIVSKSIMNNSQMNAHLKPRINQSSTRDIVAAVIIVQFIFLFIAAIMFSADGGFFTAGVFYVALVSNLLAFLGNLYRFSALLYLFGGLGSVCVFLYHAYIYALVSGTLVGYQLSANLLGHRTLLYFVGTIGGNYEVLTPSVVLHYWIIRSVVFFGLCLTCFSTVSVSSLYFLSSEDSDGTTGSNQKNRRALFDVEALSPLALNMNPIQGTLRTVKDPIYLTNNLQHIERYSPDSQFIDMRDCSLVEENDISLHSTLFDHSSGEHVSSLVYSSSNPDVVKNMPITNWNGFDQKEIYFNETLSVSTNLANSSLSTCADTLLQMKIDNVIGNSHPQNDNGPSFMLNRSGNASPEGINSSCTSLNSSIKDPWDTLPLSPSPPTRTIARVCTPTVTAIYPILSGSSQSGLDLQSSISAYAGNISDFARILSEQSAEGFMEESIDGAMENIPIH